MTHEVRELMGLEDLLSDTRGTYKSPGGAKRLLEPYGGSVSGVLEELGRRVNDPQDFDLGVTDGLADMDAVAVLCGSRAYALAKVGFVPVARNRLRGIWRMI